MKSGQSFFERQSSKAESLSWMAEPIFITPSEVIEYIFCPRFIYFMNCLDIPQHEENRYKVIKGREVHEDKSRINKEYLRKKIGCVDKEIDVYLASPDLHLRGIIDEVLFLGDGTLAPLDYKFAEFNDHVFQTHFIQSALYGLLIRENYQKEVNRGYVCYVRSNNYLKELNFSNDNFGKAMEIVENIFEIIQKSYFPSRTKSSTRCIDCCYKNICIK
jgi:CRISPR-associated exonuclease Cas4